MIEEHCVENDIIDKVEENPSSETGEVLKLKLEFEHEERQLAHEAVKKAGNAEKVLQDAQLAEAQRAREESRDLRLSELREASELRELELKAEQEKAFLEAELEVKIEATEQEHELKMAPLDGASAFDPARNISAFNHARNIRLLPSFQEKEVDKYFAHFENVAESLNWHKENWALLLQSVLFGKAQEIYGSLSVEQSSNSKHVKEENLKAYELVPNLIELRNYLKYHS